jgi:LmeA-like phospholipid-binding
VPVSRAGRIAATVIAAIVLVMALMQVLLPSIAASTISSKLRRYGHVTSVSVSAWPAFELLWGSADSVHVKARDLALSTKQAAKLLWEGRGASRVDMTSSSARIGPLRVTDVTMRKRGDGLSAQARASAADVSAALPPGLSVALVRSEGGSVEVRASGALFGASASVDAVAGPVEGRLVARPLGLLLGALQLTLFADPHVNIRGVGAQAVGSGSEPSGYELEISARLR